MKLLASSLFLMFAPPPMTTDEMITSLVENQFALTGETDAMQAERAARDGKR